MIQDKTPIVIGLHGYQRSGKDTVADMLVEDHGFTRVSFAQPLKDGLLALNPYVVAGPLSNHTRASAVVRRLADIVAEYGWEQAKDDPRWGPEIRNLLQRFGTEYGRETMWDSFWIDAAHRTIENAETQRIAITDVRFDNEADFVHSLGGLIVNVVRPGYGPKGDHKSEREVDCDLTLLNSGTLAHLKDGVDDIAQSVTSISAASANDPIKVGTTS